VSGAILRLHDFMIHTRSLTDVSATWSFVTSVHVSGIIDKHKPRLTNDIQASNR